LGKADTLGLHMLQIFRHLFCLPYIRQGDSDI